MLKLEYNGYIKDGKLFIHRKSIMDGEVAKWPDCDVEIVVSKKKRIRSLSVNKYYWAVVVGMVRDAFQELGNDVDSQLTHEFLKGRFCSKEIVNENTGEVIKIPMSTADLTPSEFSDYMAKCVQFAEEFLSITIPPPNSQMSIKV